MTHARSIMSSDGLTLCHIFVFVAPGAPEAERLRTAGLRESFRRRHPGQGTANACFCFDNAYLELLWVEDAAAMVGPEVARTRLADRARWRETGASPFGIAVRRPTQRELPFATWDYGPPYLPSGLTIPVALASEAPRHPFVFGSPGNARPDAWTDGRAGERQVRAGLAEITAVRLRVPTADTSSDALRSLEDAGVLVLEAADSDDPRMMLTISRADGRPPIQLSLPDLRWREETDPAWQA